MTPPSSDKSSHGASATAKATATKKKNKKIREDAPGPGLSTISEAIADIAAGKMVILVDD